MYFPPFAISDQQDYRGCIGVGVTEVASRLLNPDVRVEGFFQRRGIFSDPSIDDGKKGLTTRYQFKPFFARTKS
jgi:hypothetical protein